MNFLVYEKSRNYGIIKIGKFLIYMMKNPQKLNNLLTSLYLKDNYLYRVFSYKFN